MFISTTRFRCDACGVIGEPTKGWTVIETHSTAEEDGTTVIHLCIDCRPRLRHLLAWLDRAGGAC